jgi:hypothetical protein
MSSYVLDMLCVCHQYPKMGWDWKPTDPLMHMYCKVVWQQEDPDTPGVVYDDTTRLLEKGGTSLKWGEFFQMFKKKNFPVEVEDQDELKIFKNIWRSGLHRVVAHATIFPCADTISWILKHIDLDNRYILNAKGKPIVSFQAS